MTQRPNSTHKRSFSDWPNPLEDIKLKLGIKEASDEGAQKAQDPSEPKPSLGLVQILQKPGQILGFQTVTNDPAKCQGSPLINKFVSGHSPIKQAPGQSSPTTKKITKLTQSKDIKKVKTPTANLKNKKSPTKHSPRKTRQTNEKPPTTPVRQSARKPSSPALSTRKSAISKIAVFETPKKEPIAFNMQLRSSGR
jgi:hypothetical protein